MSKEKTWSERTYKSVTYKGVTYRSTLEGRWAYIFDHMNTIAAYEDDAYYLNDSLTYTPDFHIKNAMICGKKEPDVWIEVKGFVEDLNCWMDKKMKLFAEKVGPIIVVFRLPFGDDVKAFKLAMSGIHAKYYSPIGVYSTKYLNTKYLRSIKDYDANKYAMPCVTKDGRFAIAKWDDENIDWNATADIYHVGAMQWRTKNGNAGERQEVVNE